MSEFLDIIFNSKDPEGAILILADLLEKQLPRQTSQETSLSAQDLEIQAS